MQSALDIVKARVGLESAPFEWGRLPKNFDLRIESRVWKFTNKEISVGCEYIGMHDKIECKCTIFRSTSSKINTIWARATDAENGKQFSSDVEIPSTLDQFKRSLAHEFETLIEKLEQFEDATHNRMVARVKQMVHQIGLFQFKHFKTVYPTGFVSFVASRNGIDLEFYTSLDGAPTKGDELDNFKSEDGKVNGSIPDGARGEFERYHDLMELAAKKIDERQQRVHARVGLEVDWIPKNDLSQIRSEFRFNTLKFVKGREPKGHDNGVKYSWWIHPANAADDYYSSYQLVYTGNRLIVKGPPNSRMCWNNSNWQIGKSFPLTTYNEAALTVEKIFKAHPGTMNV